LVAAINLDISEEGAFISFTSHNQRHHRPLLRQINGHKRSSGAQDISGRGDKMFSESVFLWVFSQQTGWRDKMIGSRGKTADLSARSCAVICFIVGSGKPPRRRHMLPHRDNYDCHRGTVF